MDIYEVVSDFNEARLQRQLQASIEKAMSIDTASDDHHHLIDLKAINKSTEAVKNGNNLNGRNSLRRRRKKIPDSGDQTSSSCGGTDISKSVDSGVCLREDTDDTDDTDVCTYDADNGGLFCTYEEEDKQLEKLSCVRQKLRVFDSPPACQRKRVHMLDGKKSHTSSNYFIRSMSLNRRSKKISLESHQDNSTNDSLMTQSVFGTLDECEPYRRRNSVFIDSGPRSFNFPEVRRTGSNDTLLSSKFDPQNSSNFSPKFDPQLSSDFSSLKFDPQQHVTNFSDRTTDGYFSSNFYQSATNNSSTWRDFDNRGPQSLNFQISSGGSYASKNFVSTGNNEDLFSASGKAYLPLPDEGSPTIGGVETGYDSGVCLLPARKGDLLGVSMVE